QGLGELLVAAVEIADDGVYGDHRLAFEVQDGAEDPVGRGMLRAHVHGQALGTAIAHLDDVLGFEVHYVLGGSGAAPPPRPPTALFRPFAPRTGLFIYR